MSEAKGFYFWQQIDRCRMNRPLSDIAQEIGMNYQSLRDQRTNNRLPKLEVAYDLARSLHVSVEYLLTGKERATFPPRVQTIAIRCLSASDEDLSLVERVLRIEAGEKPDHSEALA